MNTKPRIGVVGAGVMGRGIAQLFAQGGHAVSIHDSGDGVASTAVASIAAMIEKGVAKKTWSREQADEFVASLRPCAKLIDLADCELVIEAIVEDIAAKQALFAQLEEIVSERAMLASNTSSLLIADIAARCRHPGRVAGLHFFNPVPLMKVVEVVAAVRTASETVQALCAIVAGTGHRAVVAADQPGFLVNHAGRGLYTEGLRILEEQVAGVEQVDTLMREAAGFRMGPFELLDLTGLDVSGKVMESIYEQFQHEPRFRPSSLVRPRIVAGLHGRKTGEGWYRYVDGARRDSLRAAVPALPSRLKLWVDAAAGDRNGVVEIAGAAGVQVVEEREAADVLLIQPWGWDATRYCHDHGLDAARTVALDPAPGLSCHRTLMLTAVTQPQARDAVHALFAHDGVAVTVINDSPGFVVQRIIATIVNIAANIAQRGIARVPDLEEAVCLGLGYPFGPLTLGDAIGPQRILDVLTRMLQQTGDPRYRPSPWLIRRVALGVSLQTPEASRT